MASASIYNAIIGCHEHLSKINVFDTLRGFSWSFLLVLIQ